MRKARPAATAGLPRRAHAAVANSAPPYWHHETSAWNVATKPDTPSRVAECVAEGFSQYASPSASAAAARVSAASSPAAACIHVAETTKATTESAASITATAFL